MKTFLWVILGLYLLYTLVAGVVLIVAGVAREDAGMALAGPFVWVLTAGAVLVVWGMVKVVRFLERRWGRPPA